MAYELKLELKMLQKLILTPQLQQAIKLLQLPQLELLQTLNNELVENPLLEETAEESQSAEEASEEASEDDAPATEDKFEDPDHSELPLEKLMGYTVGDYFDSRSYDGRDLGYFTPDTGTAQTLEHYVSDSTDLYEHLTWQLRFSETTTELRNAAEVVIGNIDENGYLQVSVQEVTEYSECSGKCAEKAISLVQTFDPTGVGARDLCECLVLQLGPLGLCGTLVEDLIVNHLDDLKKRKYPKLAQRFACTQEEIKKAVKVISMLEPKPGRGMSNTQPVYIRPDVYIVRNDGEFQVVLNDENVPHLRINSYYRKLLSIKNTLEKDEKAFLEEKLRSAVWLLKSLDHRNKTIYRVSECILEFQRGFFEHGASKLRPLNLKDVANELQMHESTISRATSNKYLSCNHGLFGFRFFFSSGVRTENGKISSTAVKDMMKKLIREENELKPLSDQKISDMLRSFDIKVARRTVAKYREELHISPHNLRKNID